MNNANAGLSPEALTQLGLLFDAANLHTELSEAQRQALLDGITGTLSYHARVGVLGKNGAGKSTLCNALFGREIAAVDAVEACTREPQDIAFAVGKDKGITLIDMPGVGENDERDIEYHTLYENLLPELDLVLWVLKADDRALTPDLQFHDQVVRPYCRKTGVPLLFVINQVDKIDPVREWDVANNQPGPEQARNIGLKCTVVTGLFDLLPHQLCTVAAISQYGLVDLVEKIVRNLPHEKKWGFTREAAPEHVSIRARLESERGVWETIQATTATVCRDGAPQVLSSLSGGVRTLFRWQG